MKQLFNLKDKNPYPSCKIYEGTCSCGSSYIGETKQNVQTRWLEHTNIKGNSEVAKHLYHNETHNFKWKILINGNKNFRIRKNLEASMIALKRPSLNEQMECKKLHLFRNGVT